MTAAETFPSTAEATTQQAIRPNPTLAGELPSIWSSAAAMRWLMPCASKTMDMEKPARNSRMSGLKNAPTATLAAAAAGIG